MTEVTIEMDLTFTTTEGITENVLRDLNLTTKKKFNLIEITSSRIRISNINLCLNMEDDITIVNLQGIIVGNTRVYVMDQLAITEISKLNTIKLVIKALVSLVIISVRVIKIITKQLD